MWSSRWWSPAAPGPTPWSGAKNAGIRAEYLEKTGFEERLNSLLAEEGIGLIVLAGFLRILSADFTRRWAGG